jgi:CheY-like chemotaxis protein
MQENNSNGPVSDGASSDGRQQHEPNITVLVVEDNPGDLALVRHMLKEQKRFQMVAASTLASAVAQIRSHPDVILLDLDLPDSQGVETLRSIRRDYESIPIIVLTGRDDRDLALQALRDDAAQDYLIKGHVDGRLLAKALSRHVKMSSQ